MKIAMINASPRLLIRKNDVSASYTILQDMRRQLRREHAHDFEDFHVKTASMGSEDIKRLMSCDVWLFSFPVYAGGLPSHLLTFLTQIEELCGQKEHPEIKVYAVGNGALYEGSAAYPALRMISVWCGKCEFSWCGGLGIGGGPTHLVSSVGQIALGQRRSYYRRLGEFVEAVAKGIPTLNTSCSPDQSRQGYCIKRNRRYRHYAKRNGLTTPDGPLQG